MNYTIRGKNITVTDAMEKHLKHSLNKLEKYKVNENDRVQCDIEYYREIKFISNVQLILSGKITF
jgi:ribosomal subunit interface protein